MAQEEYGSHPIDPRGFSTDEGLHTSANDRLVQASELLTQEEIARAVNDRAILKQARDLLILVYDIDVDDASELLKWGSQTTNLKLRTLAAQLTEGLAGLDHSEPAALRSACDDVLFAAHDTLRPASRSGHQR